MKINRAVIYKHIINVLTNLPNYPLNISKYDLTIKNDNLAIKSSKFSLLSKFFRINYNHYITFKPQSLDSYVVIHPELLPPILYSLFNQLLNNQMYPSQFKNIDSLLKAIKDFPFFSKSEKHLILFLLITGNNLNDKDQETLAEFIYDKFPEFIDITNKYEDDLNKWLQSLDTEAETLNLAVRGLLMIFADAFDFTLDFEIADYEQIIYVSEKQLELINTLWDKSCFEELDLDFQVLPMSSYSLH